jgi:hypothetical protein
MSRQAVSLEVIDIARPCPADWEEMRGDDQVRFCKHCSLNVYNLSAMSREAAQQLVAEREGRLCVRFYRRLDGTVVTTDCEGALKLAAKRFGRFAKAVTAVVLTAALAPLGFSRWLGAAPTDKSSSPTPALCAKPPQPPTVMGEAVAIMGDMVAPAPQPQPPPVQFLGRIANPAKLGQMAVPLMGAPAPLPAPPPAPATQPATATTQPVTATTLAETK